MRLFIVVLTYLTVTTAAASQSKQPDLETTHHGVLHTRQQTLSNCIGGINDSSCWSVLNLTQWLSAWYNSTIHCTQEAAEKCIMSGETWTDAFLRIAQNITGGPSCVSLNRCQGDAPNSNQIRHDVTSIDAARYRYVCYNIYAINAFFSDWYDGMHDAAFEAGNLVTNIVEAVDPPTKQSNVFLDDLLSALAAGLAFLAIPEVAALGGAAAAIAPIFLKSIQQAPGVAKIIWPIGSVQRETIEIGNLQGQLVNIVEEALEPRISQALANVMGENQTDLSLFLAFAQRGEFSGLRDQFPNITSDTSGLLLGFTTFLVSEALKLDGWHAVASLDTDPLGLTNGTASCPGWAPYDADNIQEIFDPGLPTPNDDGTYCVKHPDFNNYGLDCYGYDEYGQCINSYWWYSQDSRTAFTLAKDPYNGYFQPASKLEKDPTDILQTIFANKWSTGQLLLEHAGLCVFEAALYEAASANKDVLFSIKNHTTTIAGITPLANPLDNPFINATSVPFADFKAILSDPFLNFKITSYDLLKPNGGLSLEPSNGVNYTISKDGITNFDCTSQLNLTIYTDWASVWNLHKKLT